MGKLDLFSIYLQKPIYMAGETLIGTVNVRLNDKLKINGINMLITGDARVHWSETSTQTQKNLNGLETIHYTAYEEYLKLNMLLIEKQQNKDLYLEAGDQSFEFKIILPTNLPSSFEHQFGRVRYTLTAIINIPWSFNKKLEKFFTVLSILDLNLYPSLKQPLGGSETEFMCCGICGFFKTAPISCSFIVKKSGFVPGENIIFDAYIDNQSDQEIKRMHVSLIQNIIFYASKPKKIKNCFRNIGSVCFSKQIPPRTIEHWKKGHLKIPPVISSSNETCKIIGINYSVILNFDAVNVMISTNISIPITIGTIPLENENMVIKKNSKSSSQPSFASCAFEKDSKADLAEPEHSKSRGKSEIIKSEENDIYKPFYHYYEEL